MPDVNVVVFAIWLQVFGRQAAAALSKPPVPAEQLADAELQLFKGA